MNRVSRKMPAFLTSQAASHNRSIPTHNSTQSARRFPRVRRVFSQLPASMGFTLLEIVIVIAITSMLIILIFQALDRVRVNEARFQVKRDQEKQVYLLFNALTSLFKSTSGETLFNGLETSLYFRGLPHNVLFISRAPLVSAYGGLHYVQLHYDPRNQTLLYREQMVMQESNAQANAVTFQQLDDQPYLTLMENLQALEFQYQFFDPRHNQLTWKDNLNTFDKDPLPQRFSIQLTLEGKTYQMNFERSIKDKNQAIPPNLLIGGTATP